MIHGSQLKCAFAVVKMRLTFSALGAWEGPGDGGWRGLAGSPLRSTADTLGGVRQDRAEESGRRGLEAGEERGEGPRQGPGDTMDCIEVRAWLAVCWLERRQFFSWAAAVCGEEAGLATEFTSGVEGREEEGPGEPGDEGAEFLLHPLPPPPPPPTGLDTRTKQEEYIIRTRNTVCIGRLRLRFFGAFLCDKRQREYWNTCNYVP
ncbi:hypothetical protein F7725_001838 [Dissostichus mawsoni]|uniref:Uncharacterized protein n=1 Tax=Dissostichus mawsoni TaxID=36200 RepID=A0A7J5Y2I3_DISMA|nr:hypothetical protein F7725_001838 [Dissostichus mawsoni]